MWAPMAGETLKITGGNAVGQSIPMEQELVIGRSTPGLGSLGGDSEISRVHARVFHDPSGRLTIEDLGSTNGTFVNGNRISGQQPLNPGDQVRVGQTSLSVEGGAADAGATSVGQVIPPAAAPPAAAAAATPPTQQLPPQQPYGQGPGAPPPPGGPGYGGGGPIGGPPQRAGGGPNRNLLIALGAVLLIALVVAGLAIGGVFGGDDNKSNNTADTTTTSSTPTTTSPSVAMPSPPTTNTQTDTQGGGGNDAGYTPAFRAQFIKSCQSGGLSQSGCQCAYSRVKDAYSFPELLIALNRARQGNAPSKIKNIFIQCARENQG